MKSMCSLMRVRAEARFIGKVQGVYFRDYARRFAAELDILGWVMNMPDGSVRAVFEGEKEDIDKVVRRLRTEHPAAKVDSVEIDWSDCKGGFDRFEVRYLD
jgi:acylphosphatase